MKKESGTTAYFSSVFDGVTNSYRKVNLIEKNENCTRINNEDLYITKKGTYKAYLSVAYGATDGNFAGWGDLFVNDTKVASSCFDRIASTNTNAITYEIVVNENEEKKIEYKVISNRTLAEGNASITGSLVIVKIK